MKHKKGIKFFCYLVIIIFLFSYFVEMSGYYEYNLQSRKNLTKDQMEQFEKDIRDGKDIDLERYLKENTVDYSNDLTKSTSEISLKLNNYLKGFLTNTINLLGKLFK